MNIKMLEDILNIYGKFMHLKIFVDSTDYNLWEKYSAEIEKHNSKLAQHHIDAGFDILTPTDEHTLYPDRVNKVDYQIMCSAQIFEKEFAYNTGFYMYPRSSISKSNLRLANNVGIIDAGYRGHLIGMFDLIYEIMPIKLNQFDRHLQICAPGLIPIYVEMVKSREELGENTIRGANGIGSTGK